jgi:putative endonuclease
VNARRAAERRERLGRGLFAENLAAVFLMLKGWRILARRHAGFGGEIDIVAVRRGVVAFVEVKARRDRETALLAIDGVKQARFSRAAKHWLARNPWAATFTLRADAVLVAPWRPPSHVPDAFTLGL